MTSVTQSGRVMAQQPLPARLRPDPGLACRGGKAVSAEMK